MENGSILKWFEDYKCVALIRAGSSEDAESMIKAGIAGGFRIFEISSQIPQAIRLIETYSKKENLLIGAGSVTDGELAQRVIKAGAKFISSFFTDDDIVTVAKNNDVFVIQGASTPTEAFAAYQIGADLVKIYHVGLSGGPNFLRSIKGPLPFVKMIASGGVELENAAEYLKVATSVDIGKAVFDRSLARSNNWSEMTERAKQITQKLEIPKVTK